METVCQRFEKIQCATGTYWQQRQIEIYQRLTPQKRNIFALVEWRQKSTLLEQILMYSICFATLLKESTKIVIEHIPKPCWMASSRAKQLQRLGSDNERLKASIICQRCKVEDVQTLFLPCAGIICCERCSLCKPRVLGTVRIYFA